MRLRRAVVALLAVMVLLPVLAAGAAAVLLDGDALKARAIEAVGRATGRELTITGPVRLAWSLAPTLSAEGVSLANPPGASRPAMATLARVDVRVALWPLLRRRVEVRRLTLAGADVLLERNAAGQPNWVFARPAVPPAPDAVPAAPDAAPPSRMQVSVENVELRDARLGWLSGGRLDTVAVPLVQLRTEAPGTARVSGAASVNGVPVDVQGTMGTRATVDGAWPLDLRLSASGASVHAAGALGAAVALTADVPDLAALSALAGRALPPLRDVKASAQLGPGGLSALQAQASGDAGPVHFNRLTLAAPAPDQPLTLAVEGTAGDAPLVASGTTGSLAALALGGAVPVKAQVSAAGARMTLDGTADPRAGTMEVQAAARVPDLQALGALAGLRLPALRDAALDVRLSTGGPGVLLLRGLRLTVPGSDVSGDLALTQAPRPTIRGALVSQRLDLDALAAAAQPAPAPPPVSPSAPPTVAPPSAAPPGPSPPPAAPATAPAAALPAVRALDAPLPFEALRRLDADVQLGVAEAVWRRIAFRSVAARLLLQDGHLRVDPVTALVPGGAAAASVQADAVTQSAGFALRADGLAAGPLLQAFGLQDAATGTLDLDLNLGGAGPTLSAMRPTLQGHAGVALVDGEFDLGGILAVLGDALPKGLPVAPGGRSRVRCLALRVDAAAGRATLRTLLLDSTRLHLAGDGTVNLVDETMDLHLRPQLRLGIGGVSVPVRLSGPLRAPRPQAEISGGSGQPGLMIGAPPPPDDCAARLTEARGGRAGPMPAAAPDAPRPKPADLLRNLLR